MLNLGRKVGQPTWRLPAARFSSKGRTGSTKPLPACLATEFAALGLPGHAGLDMEWLGPRQGLPYRLHKLFIFDLWQWEETWLGKMGFAERYLMLQRMMDGRATGRVQVAPCVCNPGLPDFFAQQLANDQVEGIVMRKWDSLLVGSMNRPADNPQMFKVKFQKVTFCPQEERT